MFASIASTYPREPLPGQPDLVAEAYARARGPGTIDEAAHTAVLDAFVREVMAEQEDAGIGVLTLTGAFAGAIRSFRWRRASRA